MKRKLLPTLASIALISCIGINNVFAQDVSTEAELKACLAGTENECTLKSDITITTPTVISGEKLIDLDGNNIESTVSGAPMFEVGDSLTVSDYTESSVVTSPSVIFNVVDNGSLSLLGGNYKSGTNVIYSESSPSIKLGNDSSIFDLSGTLESTTADTPAIKVKGTDTDYKKFVNLFVKLDPSTFTKNGDFIQSAQKISYSKIKRDYDVEKIGENPAGYVGIGYTNDGTNTRYFLSFDFDEEYKDEYEVDKFIFNGKEVTLTDGEYEMDADEAYNDISVKVTVKKKEAPAEKKEEPKNPNTFDGATKNIILVVVGAIAAIASIFGLRKKNN